MNSVLFGAMVIIGAGCAALLLPPTQRTFDSLYVVTEGMEGARASIVLVECPGGGRWPVTPAHVARHISHQFPVQALTDEPDLAVLALPADWTGPGVALAVTAPARGELVWVLHAPAGMANTISLGVVSWMTERALWVSVTAFPGSSGGAVVNRGGELLGLVVGLRGPHPKWGLFQGGAFAVAAPAIRALLVTVDPACADA